MKTIIRLTCIAAPALALSTAHAEETSLAPYWSVGAGAVFAGDLEQGTFAPADAGVSSCLAIGCNPDRRIVELNPGFAVGGAVGVELWSGLRTDAEYRYSRVGLSSITPLEGDELGVGRVDEAPEGGFETHSALANLYYDAHNSTRFTPFIGGGVGAARVEDDRDRQTTSLSYQGLAGLSVTVSERVAIDAKYAYQRTSDLTFETGTDLGPAGTRGAPFKASNVTVAVRTHF